MSSAENRSQIFSLTGKFRDPDSWLEPSAETAETRASLRLSLPDVCQAVGILLSHSHYVHVSSAGIEPAFPPSEGDVLSIIRRGLFYKKTGFSPSQCLCIEKDRTRFSLLCAWQESNLRPSGPQPDALSTELQARTKPKPSKIIIRKA